MLSNIISFILRNCPDFDLCEQCESIPNVHYSSHVFLKLRKPRSIEPQNSAAGLFLILLIKYTIFYLIYLIFAT